MVDAKYGLDQLNDPNLVLEKDENKESDNSPINTAKKQIALADTILLNKLDVVSTEEKNKMLTVLEAVNSAVPIIETQFSRIPLDKILDMNAYGDELPKKLPSPSSIDSIGHIDKSIGTGIHIPTYFRFVCIFVQISVYQFIVPSKFSIFSYSCSDGANVHRKGGIATSKSSLG